MRNFSEISEKIYETYCGRLSELKNKEKIHFIRRAYRATGDESFARMIKQRAFLFTIPAIVEKQKVLSSVVNDAGSYPAVRFKKSKNSRLQRRNEFLEARPEVQFYRRYLMDLFQAKLLNLDKSLLSQEWAGYIDDLKKVDFESIYLDEDVISNVSSFAVNSVFFLSHLGVCHSLKKEFLNYIRGMYFEDGVVRDGLSNDEFVSLVYSLTHVVIADSKFYQRWVDGYDWIAEFFSNNLDDILSKCSIDVIAEVGVCYKLLSKGVGHESDVLRIKEHILRKYDVDKYLSGKWLGLREHTNCILMLMFKDIKQWCEGPHIHEMKDIDLLTPLEPERFFRSGDAYWPNHLSPRFVSDAFGYRLCGYTISLEAWRRGLGVRVESDGANAFQRYVISSKEKEIRFNTSLVDLTEPRALRSVKDKQVTRSLLEKACLPTPAGNKFNKRNNFEDLAEFANEIGYPVVLKPLNGAKGIGVFSNLKDRGVLEESYGILFDKMGVEDVVLEKHFEGDDYRVLATKIKVLSATKRLPASVTGDGKLTIDGLINKKNAQRKKNPFLITGLIRKDEEVLRYIKDSGKDLDSVLPDGEVLRLKGKANASSGGDTIDVTDYLPSDLKAAAVDAIKAIPGLEYGGVDVLYDEKSGDFSIIEINGRPQVSLNMYPSVGIGRDVPKMLIDEYFPEAPVAHGSINKQIVFDVSSLLDPLVKGVADVSSISPVKNFNDFFARKIIFESCSLKYKKSMNKKIRKFFVQRNVVGEVAFGNGNITSYIAGEREEVEKFISDLSSFLMPERKKIIRWTGPVKQGVFIH